MLQAALSKAAARHDFGSGDGGGTCETSGVACTASHGVSGWPEATLSPQRAKLRSGIVDGG